MRLKIFSTITMLFLVLTTITAVSAPAANAATELAAGQSLMQCMTNCIKHEGNTATAKSTCKLRCANVPMPNAQRGGQDCMGVYKKCNRACPKGNKPCRKSCKGKLMQCN